MRMKSVFVAVALVTVPALSFAQQGESQKPAASSATVDFGVLPTGPLGPPPCLQVGAIGGPADPCSYKIHHLTPEEVTIKQGGEVTFQIHGGGHGFAIYEVSKDTTREELGQYLCKGDDPEHIADPTLHVCNLLPANSDAAHEIKDGHDEVVITAGANVTNAHPDNRVWSPEDRLASAGGFQFLNGGTVPAGPTSNGQLITYQFTKNGRYLVLCINRVHFLNDWMFGFVNVTAEEGK
jgi:plastocyanin